MELKYNKILLYINNKIYIFSYPLDVYAFLYKSYKIGQRGAKRVRIYTNYFDLFYLYYSSKKAINSLKIKPMWAVPNIKAKMYGISILDFIEIIDNVYKYGTNTYTPEELFNSDIKFSRINAGFSGYIRKLINMEKVKEEFQPISKSIRQLLLHKTIKGPVITCRPNIDFNNPYCYDIKSAYPYWAVNLEFPETFTKTNKIVNKPHIIHYGRIIIKGLVAKKPNYLPLFLKESGADEDDVHVFKCNRRIKFAEVYTGYCFLEDTLPIIMNNYNYKSIEIDYDNLYACKTKKLPEETRNAILNLFYQKEKTGKDSDKLILNRSAYGIFITHKINKDGVKDAANYAIPYLVGIYIVSHQAWYMDSVIQKIGIEHIIAAHTDSIKADYDISDIMEEENKRSTINRLGTWEKEDIARICYYSNTRAKYITKEGQLKIKHGGIYRKDVDKFLEDKTYNSIDAFTPIELTIRRFLKPNDKGTDIIYKKITVAFGAEEEINIRDDF